MHRPSDDIILKEFGLADLVPGWRFRKVKIEDSSFLYRVEGAGPSREWISIPGNDPDKLLEECVTFADRVARALNSLTGLPNFKQRNEYLERYLENKAGDVFPLTVVEMDLDRFVYINDGLGHVVGDEILCRVGRCLEGIARKYGSPLFHQSDEYWFILTKSTPDGRKGFMDEVVAGIKSLEIRYNHPEEKWLADKLVSISVGEATITEKPENLEALLTAADESLYLNKSKRYFYET